MTRPIRPDLFVLWPAWAVFPIFGLAVLVLGVQGNDASMLGIGLGLLLINIAIVIDHAYFTTLSLEDATVVFRSHLGMSESRVPVGSIQRIDAKRYPTTHSGALSAPNLVLRGRQSTIRVNTKPYRLSELRSFVETLRSMNPAIELDDYWSALLAGREPSAQPIARSRW